MYIIITTVHAIFNIQTHCHVSKLTYISVSSLIVDCFPESIVILVVELINGRFIMLVSALLTGLPLKTMPSLHVYLCLCILHMIA